MDVHLGRSPLDMARELFAGRVPGCERCGRPADELAWISIGTSDEAWRAGDQRCGWLRVCDSCARQVDFVLDEEMTRLRREG
jgi:hypothetical protein